jgi:hypothetical protein
MKLVWYNLEAMTSSCLRRQRLQIVSHFISRITSIVFHFCDSIMKTTSYLAYLHLSNEINEKLRR